MECKWWMENYRRIEQELLVFCLSSISKEQKCSSPYTCVCIVHIEEHLSAPAHCSGVPPYSTLLKKKQSLAKK